MVHKETERKRGLTDEEVELEITRLRQSPLVKLAKKEEAIRYRRRQYMYVLRGYERRGRELTELGYTKENIEELLGDIPAEEKEG